MSKKVKQEYQTSHEGIPMKAVLPPGYHLEGMNSDKIVCDFCHETIAKIDDRSLIGNEYPLNLKHPSAIQAVINSYKAIKQIQEMPMDDLTGALRCHNKALAGINEMSQESSWTAQYDDPNCNKSVNVRVTAWHNLSDERLDWDPKTIFAKIPVKYNERTLKSHAWHANRHGFTSVQAYFDDTYKIIEERKKKPIVTINPPFERESYVQEAKQLIEIVQQELDKILEYQTSADLNERVKEMYKASMSLPDDSQFIWFDDHRGGESSNQEHELREIRQEQKQAAEKRKQDALLRSANEKLRNGVPYANLTSEEMDARLYAPPHKGLIGRLLQRIHDWHNPPGILLGPDDISG